MDEEEQERNREIRRVILDIILRLELKLTMPGEGQDQWNERNGKLNYFLPPGFLQEILDKMKEDIDD